MRPRDFCFETRVQENMSVNKQNKKEPSGVKKHSTMIQTTRKSDSSSAAKKLQAVCGCC